MLCRVGFGCDASDIAGRLWYDPANTDDDSGDGTAHRDRDSTSSSDAPILTLTMVPVTEPPLPTDTPLASADIPAPLAEAPTWPTKRESHAMAYDPQSDRVLLFCGYDTFVSALAWQHEDWT